MRQEKFMTYIDKDTGNLKYHEDDKGFLVSNSFKAVLQSAINPNYTREKETYYIKYNPKCDKYFINTKDGYSEALTYMGQNFRWSIWMDKMFLERNT